MSLIKMPYEVSNEFYLKALIYGQPGLGKSTLSVSMPKPVLIDCDNGIHRIRPEHRPPFLPVSSYQEVLDVLASPEIKEFDTIIFDTGGKLLDYMAAWIIQSDPKKGRKDGQLTMQGYGVRKYEFINLLKRLMTMKKHVVFVAHEKEEKDGDTRYIRPEMGGSSGADLIKELDLVGYMEAVGRKRTVSFTPSEKYYAKNSARLQDMIEVPELTNGRKNDFMAGVVVKCREALQEESEQVKVYNDLMETIGKDINAVKDAKTANAMMKKLGETEHIWDSKMRAWEMMQIRAGELELTWNKEKKSYEKKAQSNAI